MNLNLNLHLFWCSWWFQHISKNSRNGTIFHQVGLENPPPKKKTMFNDHLAMDFWFFSPKMDPSTLSEAAFFGSPKHILTEGGIQIGFLTAAVKSTPIRQDCFWSFHLSYRGFFWDTSRKIVGGFNKTIVQMRWFPEVGVNRNMSKGHPFWSFLLIF